MKIYEGTEDEMEFFQVEGENIKEAARKGLNITMISFPSTELHPIRVASKKVLDATDCDAVANALGIFGIEEYKIQRERIDFK